MNFFNTGNKYDFDPEQPQWKSKSSKTSSRLSKCSAKRRKNSSFFVAFVVFCSIILVTLLFFLVRKIKTNNDYRNLAEQVQETDKDVADSSQDVSNENEPVADSILPKYQDLYEENPEFFGWLCMEDTPLDYPVMRSFENNDEYLYADFDGEYCYAGIPFADYKCSRDSDNILIYGHNIRDGSMFRSLFKYEDEEYWKDHPTIMFSDLYGDYEYEVLAAFYDRVYYKHEDCFKFYQFIEAEDKDDFDYAISQYKDKAIYDTGVNVEYGDKLISLITCAYHEENGRFVVVAVRK